MPEPADTTQHRCPVCWTAFTAISPQARYCCGACRVEDWRRRREEPTLNIPSRDDNETTAPPPAAHCPVCQRAFTPIGRQLYCCPNCRKTAWRRRTTLDAPTPTPVPPPGLRRQATVYACPDCDSRYLGEQHCTDCNTFCYRIGPGGNCPHCDEPVALTDLTNPDTPQEAITMPAH